MQFQLTSLRTSQCRIAPVSADTCPILEVFFVEITEVISKVLNPQYSPTCSSCLLRTIFAAETLGGIGKPVRNNYTSAPVGPGFLSRNQAQLDVMSLLCHFKTSSRCDAKKWQPFHEFRDSIRMIPQCNAMRTPTEPRRPSYTMHWLRNSIMSLQPYRDVHALATMHLEPTAAVYNLSGCCLLLCQNYVITEPGTNSLYSAT